ncbi:hypothetical protein M433DRAFT_9721 [Acidomyces richmondensis BFW]|nr:hypothetical protein M433DRAFT_9721 [Acidomyces richmondensis BFW]
MAEESSNKIPKLRGKENYKLWSAIVQKTLKGRGEWIYIDPNAVSSRKPSPPTKEAGDTEAAFNQSLQAFNTSVLAPWEVADAKTASYIIVNCTASIQDIISSYETSKEIWDYLEKQYRSSGTGHRMSTFEEWDSLYFEGKDLEEYCIKYQQSICIHQQG